MKCVGKLIIDLILGRYNLTDGEVARREGDCDRKVVPTGFLPASHKFGGAQKYCVPLDFWDRDELGVFKIYQVSGDHGCHVGF